MTYVMYNFDLGYVQVLKRQTNVFHTHFNVKFFEGSDPYSSNPDPDLAKNLNPDPDTGRL